MWCDVREKKISITFFSYYKADNYTLKNMDGELTPCGGYIILTVLVLI